MSEMITKEIEIFATGEYPQGKFGDKELSEIVSTYNPDLHEAPQVLGHTSDYQDSKAPAVGWIKSVKKVGNKLVAVAECGEQLVSAVKDGLFKKRSIGLYSPKDPSNPTPNFWSLHHVAWLGASPPQVKGLADVAFAQFEEDRKEKIDLKFAELNMSDFETAAKKETYDTMEMKFPQCLGK